MNTTKIAIIVVILAVIGIGAYLFTSANPSQTESQNEENVMNEAIQEDNSEEMEMEPEVVIDMTGDNFAFDPSEITVSQGQVVKIVLTANDMPHDFVIDELSVKSDLAQAGETVELEFVATETGSFEYYCSVGNHREMGMVGTLTVTE